MNSTISNMFKVRFVTIFWIFILLCMLSINTGQCRPELKRHRSVPEGEISKAQRLMQPCFENADTMALCQRCAKETKSDKVLPSCCSNEDNVNDYCVSYLNFGQ